MSSNSKPDASILRFTSPLSPEQRQTIATRQESFVQSYGLNLFLPLAAPLPDVGVFAKDRESRYIFANPTLFLALGCTCPEQIYGTSDHDHFLPSIADDLLREDQEVMRDNTQIRASRTTLHPLCESQRSVIITKLPLCGRDGSIVGLFGFYRKTLQETPDRATLTQTDKCISKIVHLITEEPGVKFTQQWIQESIGIPMHEFETPLMACLGVTAHEFVRSIQLRRICRELLADPHETVSDVAERCGFRNPAHFSTMFRTFSGSSPLSFREKWISKTCDHLAPV